jgi:cell division topological specificity factor
MSLLARLLNKQKKAPASVARERLQVIIAQTGSCAPDYLPQLRSDIMEVISRYVSISPSDVNVNVSRKGRESLLELDVALPSE